MKSIKKMLIAFLLLCIMAFSVTGCFNKQVILAPEDKMPNIAHIYYTEANSDEVYIDYRLLKVFISIYIMKKT